jgi:hypothetical protein
VTLYAVLFADARRTLGDEPGWTDVVSTYANDAWAVTWDKATGAWQYSKAKAHTAYKVAADEATPYIVSAKEKIAAAAEVSWVWATAGANDAWQWVKEQAATSKAWIADKGENAWLMTRETSGELYLWVKVKADESGATSYVRTTLDDAWTWTTDTAGKTWIWIKEHKVQVVVVVAIITMLVVAFVTRGAVKPTTLRQLYSSVGRQFPNAVNRNEFGAIAARTFDSRANAGNYRSTFIKLLAKPLPAGFEVHHSYPQKYESLMKAKGINVHNPLHLQGVDKATHARITRLWAEWERKLARSPSAGEIIRQKLVIDQTFSGKLIEAVLQP